MGERPTLLWHHRDLRLADHLALSAAAARGPVVPVFVWAPEEQEPWPPGAATRWWLHHSLARLIEDYQRCGVRLVVCRGPSEHALLTLARQIGAGAVYWTRRYEPALVRRDTRLKRVLRGAGLDARSFAGRLLHEPAREPLEETSFAGFERRFLAGLRLPPQLPVPELRGVAVPQGADLDELGLLPRVRWDDGIAAHWQPGEEGARARLEAFLARDGARQYAARREAPAVDGTSSLSPHLTFGEVGVAELWRRAQDVGYEGRGFLRQLVWRELAHALLLHHPTLPERCLDRRFDGFGWRGAELARSDVRAWQRGETGYDLVDAGMKQLWRVGWMHNRVRMVVASFLTKHLLVDWRVGQSWFWDTLVDADLANNAMGWQWSAGCGSDPVGFPRIFNPERQAERYDESGAYRQHWLDGRTLAPPRLVEHAAARQRALDAWEALHDR